MEDLIPVLFSLLVLGLVVSALVADSTRRRQRRAALEELARGLDGGRAEALEGGLLSRCRVLGRLDGREVVVRFERRGAGRHKYHAAILEVAVRDPAAGFEVESAGLLDRLGRWLGADGDAFVDDDHVVRGGARAVGRLFQAAGVQAALRRVLSLPGVRSASLRGAALGVEQRVPRGDLSAAALRVALEALVALARRCDRVPVKVTARDASPRFAWTDGGRETRCPYCRDALDPDAEVVLACARCGTVHHRACLEEAGGCTVFGCGARAAAREPSR